MHESATAVLARLWSVVGLDRFAAASLENLLLVALIGLMVSAECCSLRRSFAVTKARTLRDVRR
jgi:hypothetical protein